MQNVFTTFASSRFIDQAAVIEALRQCAQRLKAQQTPVKAVYLFGSFAAGEATPRSDADVAIELGQTESELRQEVWQAAVTIFLEAPVPVDLFILSSAQLAAGKYGLAGCVARTGVRLA